MPRPISRLALAAFATFLLAAAPDDGVPPPVQGITFDEWASANTRLAAGRPLPEVLQTLGVAEPAWQAANDAFGKALAAGPPGGPLIARYGAVFNNPNAGRFAAAGAAPKSVPFDTYADYARVQAEMTAAQEAGQDPTEVLRRKYGLTPYDYAQAGNRWVREMAEAGAHDPARLREMQRIQADALDVARSRYDVGGRKRAVD